MQKSIQPNLRILGALLCILASHVLEIKAQTIQSVRDGNWNDPATWNLGRIPALNDEVVILDQVTTATTTVNVHTVRMNSPQANLIMGGNLINSISYLILDEGTCTIQNGSHTIDSIIVNNGNFELGIANINAKAFLLNQGSFIATNQGGLTLQDEFFVGLNTTFDIGVARLTVQGISRINGAFQDGQTDGLNQFLGDVFVNGSFQVDSTASACEFYEDLQVNGTINLLSNSSISFLGSSPQTFEVNQAFTLLRGSIAVSSPELIISGNSFINFINTFSIQSATTINNQNSGITQLNEALLGEGTWINSSGSTLSYRAEQAPLSNGAVNGTFISDAANNTVLYSREGNQNILPGNYANLTLSGSDLKTLLPGNYIISGNALISNNATLASSNAGDIDIVFQQDLELENNAAFSPDLSANSILHFQNGITNSGQFTPRGNGIVRFETNNQSLNNTGTCTIDLATQVQVDLDLLSGNPLSFAKAVDVAASRTLNNLNASLEIGGDLSGSGTFQNNNNNTFLYGGQAEPLVNGSFLVSANGSRVIYNRNGAQTIRPVNYVHLELINSGNKSLGANLTVSGDFNLANNTTLVESNPNLSLEFQGNMALDGQIQGQGGLYRLSGNAAQTLSGSNNQVAFDRLDMDNPLGLSLDNLSLQVNNVLQLSRGVINTQTSTLLLSNGINLLNPDPSSYVNGRITKIGNEAFTFPTGNASYQAPIEITNLGNADNNTRFTAQYFSSPPPNAENIGQGIGFVSSREYWTLERSGNGEAQVTLYWNDQTVSGIDDPDDLRVAKLDSTQWNDGGAVATTKNNADGSITSEQQNTFQAFTFASLNGGNALGNTSQVPGNPSLLQVKPLLDQPRIQITWSQDPDQQKITSHYRIERRIGPNGVFETIADNISRTDTSFLDTDIKILTTYFYRVFAINAIASSSSSEILGAVPTLVTGDRGNPLQNAVTFFPMPFDSKVRFSIKHNYTGMLELSFYNNSGERLQYHRLEKQFTEQEFEILTQDLANGAYIVVLSGPFGSSSWKIIKK